MALSKSSFYRRPVPVCSRLRVFRIDPDRFGVVDDGLVEIALVVGGEARLYASIACCSFDGPQPEKSNNPISKTAPVSVPVR